MRLLIWWYKVESAAHMVEAYLARHRGDMRYAAECELLAVRASSAAQLAALKNNRLSYK